MKKILTAIILLIALLVTMAGCGGGNGGQESAQQKELVIALPEEIEGTDIQQVKWSNIVHELLFQPLVSFDTELKKLLPEGAASYEISADGTEFTFKLPQDSTFSNGDSLTSDEIKKSLERYKETSPYSEDLAPVKEIIAKDPQTLVMKLENSAAFLWPVLASTYAGVVNTNQAEELGNETFNRNSTGNGIAVLKEWMQGSHVSFVKNENYKTNNPMFDNKGPIKFDKITVKFIPEGFTRIGELESGNADIVINVPLENVEQLEQNKDIQLFKYLQSGVDFITINTKAEPLNDIKVRTALSLAIDKDELKEALKNTVVPKYSLISSAQLCYDEKKEAEFKQKYGYNLEKAKTLLAEAGFSDTNNDGVLEKNGKPLSISMMVPLDSPFLKQAAPLIQSQLKKAGVDLELREYESKYIKQAVVDHDFQLAQRFFHWNDPDILYYYFGSPSGGPWGGKQWYGLMEEARYIMDMEQRTAKYNELQDAIISEMPAIPLFSEYQYVAANKTISGIKVSVDGRIMLNDADIVK